MQKLIPGLLSAVALEIAIARKVETINDGNFLAKGINGHIMFIERGAHQPHLSFHAPRVLLDYAGNPLITLQKKLRSLHRRWEVFRGESTEPKDLIFSLKKFSMLQLNTNNLDVFLARNTTKNAPDFKVKGSWSERSYAIYAGDSSTIVAKMHDNHTVNSSLLGKDNFMVTVYRGVDHAFIVALIMILDKINNDPD